MLGIQQPGRASSRRSRSASSPSRRGKSIVRIKGIPSYILPGPLLIGKTLVDRLADAVGRAVDHAADHLRGADRGGDASA